MIRCHFYFLLPAERRFMTQKRKPDIILGNYWSDNDHFADLYNAVLFDGKPVLLPEDLEELDSNVSHIFEHKDLIQNIVANRDVLKIVKHSQKHGINLAILGIENQDRIHYAMPLRVMEYDTLSYMRQYNENAKNYTCEQGLTKDEFLSKMKQTDKFVPVITLVIYYGEKEWDGAKSLKQMLALTPEMEQYVNDYHMHLVEIKNSNLKLNHKHNKDLFQICSMLYNHSETLAQRKEHVTNYAEQHHVDQNVLHTAGAIVGKELTITQKEGKTMCSFFEELEAQCRQEGKLQKACQVVRNAMEKLGLSLEAACELAEISVDNYKEYELAQSTVS